MAYGPEAGLELVEAIAATGALAEYHLLPSVRGELLERLGRVDEARAAFAEAAAMTANEHERAILLARATA
jgi:predicted RNA polymerase sigma factor